MTELRRVAPRDPAQALLRTNAGVDRAGAFNPARMGFDVLAEAAAARAVIGGWPGYAPTPLHDLPATARALGVAALHCKDEGGRFGLGSFKALGAPYAVHRLLASTDRKPADVTVACITDGNHGRALAWGARQLGCKAVVYIPRGVSRARIDAIADQGARVVEVDLVYDDALGRLREDAAREGWDIVSDLAYPGYEELPRACMAGYAVMVDEILAARPQPPTHVLIQGGCGGFAAAVLAGFWARLGAKRPHLTVIEPASAACLLEAAEAGGPVRVDGELDTLMGGLACGVVSLAAWPILRDGVDAWMILPEATIVPAMRDLARPAGGDPAIVAGETGAAGLAALRLIAGRPDYAARIGLGPDSDVLIFVCEGATDPGRYQELVGQA